METNEIDCSKLSLYDSYKQEFKIVYDYFYNLHLKDLNRWLIVKQLSGNCYLMKVG